MRRIRNKKWVRNHYRHQPRGLRKVLIDDFLSRDIPTLKRYLERYPKNYPLHSSIADCYWRLGKKRNALMMWTKTIRIFPKAANPFFQRANWALEKYDFREAAKYLRLCLKKDKGYFRITAHFWRAESLFRIGHYLAAKKELKHVSDDYEDIYFLDYKKRTKADLLRDINSALQCILMS